MGGRENGPKKGDNKMTEGQAWLYLASAWAGAAYAGANEVEGYEGLCGTIQHLHSIGVPISTRTRMRQRLRRVMSHRGNLAGHITGRFLFPRTARGAALRAKLAMRLANVK